LHKRGRRLFFFSIALLIGVAAGVSLGWTVNPLNRSDVKPQQLRIDYQTDYVLMVSELYQSEADISRAVARMAFLNDNAPLETLNLTINYAQENNYAPDDITKMLNLAAAITSLLPASN